MNLIARKMALLEKTIKVENELVYSTGYCTCSIDQRTKEKVLDLMEKIRKTY